MIHPEPVPSEAGKVAPALQDCGNEGTQQRAHPNREGVNRAVCVIAPLLASRRSCCYPDSPPCGRVPGGLLRSVDEQGEPLPRAVGLPGVLGPHLHQLPGKP